MHRNSHNVKAAADYLHGVIDGSDSDLVGSLLRLEGSDQSFSVFSEHGWQCFVLLGESCFAF